MRKQRAGKLLVISVLMTLSGSAFASGFQLFEENGAGVGDYDAGGAAIAQDASTAFYNPAGLVRIPNQQMVVSADGVFTSTKFTGSTTLNTPPVPVPYTQTGSVQGGGAFVIPSFEYAAPMSQSVVFGLSGTVPFGLETDYGTNSVASYAASQSSLEVYDLSPNLGFKLTDKFSLGAGIDFDYIDAELDSVASLAPISSPPFPFAIAPHQFDSTSENDASGYGYGWHVGALYQFTQDTRVGIAYRSKVSASLTGTSTLTGPLAGGPFVPGGGQYESQQVTSEITLPAMTTLSIFHQINNAWAVMGSANYTEWGVFDSLGLNGVMGITPTFGPNPINVNIPENFHNTWRVATGASYQATDKWLFRSGVGYDQSPTNNTDRSLRLPDGNRFALAVGAHYQVTKTVGLDGGWTHLFVQDAPINTVQQTGSSQVTTVGNSQNSVDVVGLQLTWDIV